MLIRAGSLVGRAVWTRTGTVRPHIVPFRRETILPDSLALQNTRCFPLGLIGSLNSCHRSLACETDAAYAESRDELELVRLQYQQAEFEARMAKRSAAEAEAALAAALDASAATEAALAASIAAREKEDRRRGEEGTNDGELAELLQELDNVHVEMTGVFPLLPANRTGVQEFGLTAGSCVLAWLGAILPCFAWQLI